MKKSPRKTPPFLDSNGCPLPHSVAEVGFVRLGGAEQWVLMRGADTESNPILVMLHGGPGFSETTFWRYYNSAALEQAFTVIYWDQRGSGKSFNPTTTRKESMTVDQFVKGM